MKNTISVVMTTYNGEKYITEQLDTLRKQSVAVDEVIIADDCSTDNTVEVIKEYINSYALAGTWHVYVNAENLGWKDNFHAVIRKANSDIVFFSDQDDVWHCDKIKKMIAAIEDNKQINVLSCRANLIDSQSKELIASRGVIPFAEQKTSAEIEQNRVNEKFTYSIMPGCTMCVRRDFINKLYSISYADKLPHDALFWKIGTLLNSAYYYNDALIDYRIHNNNASNPQINSNYQAKKKRRRQWEAEIFSDQMRTVIEIYRQLAPDGEYGNILNEIYSFTKWRVEFFWKKDIYKILFNAKYYRNMKMMCGDVLAIYNP